MHKQLGEDRTSSAGDVLADRQTDRHGHHNTMLPYWGHWRHQLWGTGAFRHCLLHSEAIQSMMAISYL